MKIIRMGSRQSQLALWQTEYVRGLLQHRYPEYEYEIIPMRTKGDKLLDVSLSKIGDKGLFTRELEQALLEGKIDLAVHSMKDLPTQLPEGLCIGAMTKRMDPRDALLSLNHVRITDLPVGAQIGTSSLRRQAQLLHLRPDLKMVDLRGNIGTRVQRLAEGQLAAIVLAAAGVERLGWQDKITEKLDYSICLPAVGQGSLGIEVREDDHIILELLREITHQATTQAILAERALLSTLEGGCQIPLGAIAEVSGNVLYLRGMVANLEGTKLLKAEHSGQALESEKIGRELAQMLLAQGAGEILECIKKGASYE